MILLVLILLVVVDKDIIIIRGRMMVMIFEGLHAVIIL
jgi:hypothetical protein